MITQKELKELFDYHEDGYFIHKSDGSQLGQYPRNSHTQRIIQSIKGTDYRMDRLIYIWHHGDVVESKHIMKHLNRKNLDSRIENLELIDRFVILKRGGRR